MFNHTNLVTPQIFFSVRVNNRVVEGASQFVGEKIGRRSTMAVNYVKKIGRSRSLSSSPLRNPPRSALSQEGSSPLQLYR